MTGSVIPLPARSWRARLLRNHRGVQLRCHYGLRLGRNSYVGLFVVVEVVTIEKDGACHLLQQSFVLAVSHFDTRTNCGRLLLVQSMMSICVGDLPLFDEARIWSLNRVNARSLSHTGMSCPIHCYLRRGERAVEHFGVELMLAVINLFGSGEIRPYPCIVHLV